MGTVSNSLRTLLADARFPTGDPLHSGGVEEACAAGLVTDMVTLRSFLYGRLWTTGMLGAFAAAAVCARALTPRSSDSLFRHAEAEIDARIPSPAAREASRQQGGALLRRAIAVADSEVFDILIRATTSSRQRPHYPVTVGAVAAVAGMSPEDAAESAAYASVAGAAFAAEKLLALDASEIGDLGVEMAPEVGRLAREAGQTCLRPLSQMPAFVAPALEYLAESGATRPKRSFAS